MNLPNKLTIVRILMIPVFMFLLLYNSQSYQTWAAIVFIIASLTDTLDGYIARKYNLVTNFGKFMDPLADKLLVTSAFLGNRHPSRMVRHGNSDSGICHHRHSYPGSQRRDRNRRQQVGKIKNDQSNDGDCCRIVQQFVPQLPLGSNLALYCPGTHHHFRCRLCREKYKTL